MRWSGSRKRLRRASTSGWKSSAEALSGRESNPLLWSGHGKPLTFDSVGRRSAGFDERFLSPVRRSTGTRFLATSLEVFSGTASRDLRLRRTSEGFASDSDDCLLACYNSAFPHGARFQCKGFIAMS